MSERGLIVAIYGMNNIGKSSVIEGVLNCLPDRVAKIKYPIYDLEPTGPRLNMYLRGGNREGLMTFEAQQLFAQNRWDFQPELLNLASRNRFVVLEDYIGTGIAWGEINGVPIARGEEYNKGLFEPDLAILLDGERFIGGIEINHLHESAGDRVWTEGRRTHQILAKLYDWETVRVVRGELEREIAEVTELILNREIRGIK